MQHLLTLFLILNSAFVFAQNIIPLEGSALGKIEIVLNKPILFNQDKFLTVIAEDSLKLEDYDYEKEGSECTLIKVYNSQWKSASFAFRQIDSEMKNWEMNAGTKLTSSYAYFYRWTAHNRGISISFYINGGKASSYTDGTGYDLTLDCRTDASTLDDTLLKKINAVIGYFALIRAKSK